MKSRITKALAACRKTGRKAFIPFITAGDPDLKITELLVHALDAAGATVIELGVPFSDPMADGPIIQKSSERALRKGTHLGKILELVARVRKRSQVPLLLMGYYNPILQYGLAAFASAAAKAGVDGVLVVDLPAEEAGDLRAALRGKSIDMIYLLAPTSDEKRIRLVQRYGRGFVYYVSLTGITGAANLNPSDVAANLKRVRAHLDLPIMVGFGISTPDHVKAVAPLGDGVVVGSALVKLIDKHAKARDLVIRVKKFVHQMVKAVNSPLAGDL